MSTGMSTQSVRPDRLPSRLLQAWIPARLNRLLWTLLAALGGIFSLAGSSVRALVVAQLTDTSPWGALANGIALAVVSLAIGLGIAGWLLRRWSDVEMTTFRQVVALLSAFIATGVSHTVLVALVGDGRKADLPLAQVAQFALVVPINIIVCVIILYVARRERDLEDSYKAVLAANIALVREEEDVRARIFDELHGSAQARIVEARMRAQSIADRCSDEVLAADARQLDAALLDLYQSQIGRMARALYPAGLEVSLRAAIEQLGERNIGVIRLVCTYDPLFAFLDDPLNAGLYRDLRVAMYRVIEECVTNAIRHGGSDEIWLEVSADVGHGDPVIVLSASNECRTEPSSRWGHGLTRMRQRVAALGGEINIEIDHTRYTVRAVVPTVQPRLLASNVPAGESHA